MQNATSTIIRLVAPFQLPRDYQNMNTIIKNILTPFASAATGAIAGIIVAVFLFGIRDPVLTKLFAFAGAFFGVLSNLNRSRIGVTKNRSPSNGLPTQDREATHIPSETKWQENARKMQIAQEQEAKKKLLEAEHEARRRICTHCNNKTESIYRYRRGDGQPDMRYRDNPILCDKCFKPYAGIRPWKLPK